MRDMPQFRGLIVYRHLLYRWVRNLSYTLRGYRFAETRSSECLENQWVRFQCPVINHPTQTDLLDSKLHNMAIAVRAIDGLILAPGEIFSFWKIISRPSEKGGFQSGPTFENGHMVSSFGGGLCQISGLVFNLALEAGCRILERHSHSLDAYGDRRYLPLGRDATVAWKSKDLAFQNSTGQPIRISIGVKRTHAYGVIESNSPMPFQIKISCEDFPVASERRAAVAKRLVIHNGNEWTKADIFKSEYKMLS